jgi:RND family efflux transporter MFP subunit
MVAIKWRGRKKLILGGVILFAASALLSGCGEKEAPPPDVIRPIKILKLGETTGLKNLEYPGTVESAQHSRMGFEVPGRMVEFPVVEGDRLKKGDVIARLDPRDFEEDLKKQQAQAAYRKAEYERREELYKEGVDSKQVRDRALANYEMTASTVATAKKALEDTVLRAPYDGVVAAKLVKDFRNVQAKEQVVIFEDDTYLKIAVALPEVDYARLTPGLTLSERNALTDLHDVVSSVPGHSFPAQIIEIAKIADPITRTFRITLSFERPSDVIVSAGMTAKAVASVGGAKSLISGGFMIPVQAARGDEGGNSFVWTVDSSTMEVHRTEVKLGEVSGAMIQVVSGLVVGNEVAISGVGQLREGMQVGRFGG